MTPLQRSHIPAPDLCLCVKAMLGESCRESPDVEEE